MMCRTRSSSATWKIVFCSGTKRLIVFTVGGRTRLLDRTFTTSYSQRKSNASIREYARWEKPANGTVNCARKPNQEKRSSWKVDGDCTRPNAAQRNTL